MAVLEKQFLCFLVATCGVLGTEKVENYIRKHKWNQNLLASLEDDYEVVYPFQIRDRSRVGIETKNYYFTNATYHFESATFVIRSSFKRFKLHLRLNRELIPKGAIYKQVLRPRDTLTPSDLVENCYYQGQIHNEPNSAVAVSSCYGLRAVMFSENETYVLIPLKGGDSGRRHPHLFYKAVWHKKFVCGNGEQTEWSRSVDRKHTYARRSRHRRDSAREEKYLELALVADYNLAAHYDFDFQHLLPSTLEAVNIVDLIYHKNLNTRISLVYLEAWMQNNVITLSGDIRQTVLNFLEYSSRELYSETKDAALFLTPHRFSRRESSMSTSGTVCTAKAAGVIQMSTQFRVYESAVTMAHNIGHILGMTHDTSGQSCDCNRENVCVMREMIGTKKEGFGSVFSQCSVNEYLSLLNEGKGRCLFNKPMKKSTLNWCGNKVVDTGEECDCGNIEECDKIDPCCDPVTCKLKAEAQCASGPCCDGCKLRPLGHMCRESSDECDAPEACDGHSGTCPTDSRMVNGAVCANGDGVCYLGKCATRNKQCGEIWGRGALDSESVCYERFNQLGFQHGHCGKDEDGSYRSCDLRNVRCGLLHCRNGSDSAKLDSDANSLKTMIDAGEKSFECKSVSDENLGMVLDGAKCGDNGICLNGACVPLTDILSSESQCPTNNLALDCSGHGVCTTENWCYCNEGWKGEDCGTRSAVKKLPTDSFVPLDTGFEKGDFDSSRDAILNTKLDVSSMLIILGGVAGGIVLLLLFLLLCYRRRTTSALRKKKLAARMEMDRASESSMDTAQRSIKFGSMPSYRDEKLRMKKKQRRALHKIHEVSDERDSVSNKSRESGDPSLLLQGVSPSTKSATVVSPMGCNTHPDRGILKNGERTRGMQDSDGDVLSPLLPRHQSAIGMVVSPNPGTPSADGGYESEPPTYTAYRIFEKSMRKLDEYGCSSPYHVPVLEGSRGTPILIRSPQSECWDGNRGQIYVQRIPSNIHRNQRGKNLNSRSQPFSPPLQRTSQNNSNPGVPIRKARGGYATDTEVGYTPQMVRRSSQGSSSGGSPPPPSFRNKLDARGRESEPERVSPTNSVASSHRQPQPLKLENIEYLLKQLEPNASTSLSPTSSAEFSATEADKCVMEEVVSNTESHRDDRGRYLDHHSAAMRMNGSDCQFESYSASAVQSFNCNPLTPTGDVSRYSNGSTERAGSS